MNNEIKVILANDKAEEMAKTEEILVKYGYIVVGKAYNGLELQSLISANPNVSVVVLDVMLAENPQYCVVQGCVSILNDMDGDKKRRYAITR